MTWARATVSCPHHGPVMRQAEHRDAVQATAWAVDQALHLSSMTCSCPERTIHADCILRGKGEHHAP